MVIPAPLVPAAAPAPARRWGTATWLRGLALTALLVGFVGAATWVLALSPLGYSRFDLLEGDRRLGVDRPGTYVVFEEFDGASRPRLPTPVAVTVQAEGGDAVDVELLVGPGERAAPLAYDLMGREGRGVARFEITEPGDYLLRVSPMIGVRLDDYRMLEPTTMALAPERASTWVGGWAGLVVLAGVPLLVAGGLAVAARRVAFAHGRPASRDRTALGQP